ncbi:MAG: phospholipid carrier-dependent glycosyltransferase [Firmicutes bacterium]|nr:phospholipid carrier-dependent glycosyltransferase [Bacillota bacterium]
MKKGKFKFPKFSKLKKIFDEESRKLGKVDWIIIGVLVLVYGIISFTNLGTFTNPQTFYKFEEVGDDLSIEIKEEEDISILRVYSGPEVGSYDIYVSSDGSNFEHLTNFEQGMVFSWNDFNIDGTFRYLRIVSSSDGGYLGEIQLYDKYGSKVEMSALDEKSEVLVDEKDTVPATISHMNSAYFDEIYFARSAYEYIHGIPTVEWVHPPLGKLIMTLPIMLFGMCTFAYRFMGNIAGILMIPVMYSLGKTIFKNRKWGLLAGLLMMFDCFHFAQTRMATVDSFLVLFMMLAVLFMYKYVLLKKDAELKEKIKYLFLSGLFMGCAITTKWTGFYVALGLAIMFFADVISKNFGKNKTRDKDLFRIIGYCVVFFVVIPALIYMLSYFFFPNVYNYHTNTIAGFIQQIKDMYGYHSTLEATHPFTSEWYTWPLMERPVWYYAQDFGGGMRATISGIGNPAIWWVGAICSIILLGLAILQKKKEHCIILLFILCTWLPYLFIGRIMFMYHYFPTLPFVMLAIVAVMKLITDKMKNHSIYVFYVAVVILFFTYFYPAISGMVTSSEYLDTLLWLPHWYF